MKIRTVLFLFSGSLFLFGCNLTTISGKYCVDKKGASVIDCMVFNNGFVEIEPSFLGRAFKYTVSGDKIYVEDPDQGIIPYTIIDNNTIECNTFGVAGVFKKKE